MDKYQSSKRDTERKFLLEVIRCLHYLGRRQNHDWNDNFTQLLRLHSKNDKNILYHLKGKTGHKYTHDDMQNEILDIMTVLLLQEGLETIRKRRFFP